MSYGLDYSLAAQSAGWERAAFIRRTYAHLAGAILAFVGLETFLFQVVPQESLVKFAVGLSHSWIIVILAFMAAGWLAQVWARSDTSRGLQYLGLGLYVVLEAVIFLPLLVMAVFYTDDKTIIPTAGILTLAVFAGLTASVFITKKDYSPLGPVLCVGTFIALGVIVAACVCGFSLGLFFSFAMVALLSGYILYDTSNVLHHYRTDQHVSAALALFSDIVTLFWWVLRILLSLSSRD
jgi:FtsH-binding integral membrane protein